MLGASIVGQCSCRRQPLGRVRLGEDESETAIGQLLGQMSGDVASLVQVMPISA